MPTIPDSGDFRHVGAAEIVCACEVLLLAGFTQEAIAVLARTVIDEEGLRAALMERGDG